MAWLAPLIPIAYDMLRPKPGAPNVRIPSIPDRSAYIDKLLESAFNPQSELYALAQDRVRQNVARDLARRGIMGSAAEQYRVGQANELANMFLENELKRRMEALSTANNYDQIHSGLALNADQMYNENAWRGTGLAEQRDQAMVRNIGGVADWWTRLDAKNDMNDRLDAEIKRNQTNFDNFLNAYQGRQANSGGTMYGPWDDPSAYSWRGK